MVDNSSTSKADDVARVYLGILLATAGHSTQIVEAALAMALTLVGERHGLAGSGLRSWIDTIATAATLAVDRHPLDVRVARTRELLN
jgi:hypothetical protein